MLPSVETLEAIYNSWDFWESSIHLGKPLVNQSVLVEDMNIWSIIFTWILLIKIDKTDKAQAYVSLFEFKMILLLTFVDLNLSHWLSMISFK